VSDVSRIPHVPTDVEAFTAELRDLRERLTTDWSAPGLRVTESVVAAVDETLAELDRSGTRWPLVATLLRVKSYICGGRAPKEPFREDADHNDSVGTSVYSVLDDLQFRAAMAAGMMPAGMTVYHADGSSYSEPLDTTLADSPTIRLMDACSRRYARRRAARERGRRAEGR
jgi:hypothetical protein